MPRRAGPALLLCLLALGAAPAHAAQPPVVVVVFDALPVQLLEDASHRIDAQRFPNFAAMAREGTWYRNATTVSESTRYSVPAMLDGRQPRPSAHETLHYHPRNLFTLLSPAYRLNVWEQATQLCPCTHKPRGSVVSRLRHGRARRFREAIARIDSSPERPQLSFIHIFLPHEPRQFLPDGRQYRRGDSADALGDPRTYDNRFLTEQIVQRTLLQLEFTDRLVGELIAQLKSRGVYERSLIALMSDHGESFDVKGSPAGAFVPGALTFRRAVTPRNIEDIAGIAMFVKYPGQTTGGIDDRYVRHTDLLPTSLDEAGVARPSGLIGHDLRDAAYTGHSDVAVEKQDGKVVSLPIGRYEARRDASNAHRISLFGTGLESVFAFGPDPELLGLRVNELTVEKRGRLRAQLATARDMAAVKTRSWFLPAQAYGSLSGGDARGHTLAFALNGTVVATAPSFAALPGTKLSFSAMLPPEAFRDGRNRLEIFEVLRGRRVRRL